MKQEPFWEARFLAYDVISTIWCAQNIGVL